MLIVLSSRIRTPGAAALPRTTPTPPAPASIPAPAVTRAKAPYADVPAHMVSFRSRANPRLRAMTPAHSPRYRARLAVLAPLLLVACPKPEPPGLEHATDASTDTELPGTTEPDDSATATPTTGALPGDTDPPTTSDTTTDPTSGTTTGTTGHDLSTSTGEQSTTTAPHFDDCPLDPPGVVVGLTRVDADIPTDLGVRPCGAVEEFAALSVISADPDHLEATLCAEPTCGACDPASALTLSITVPEPFEGLPDPLESGDCVRLTAAWDHAGEQPGACTISSLILAHNHGGQPEPLPRFLYRHTASLPATDLAGPFSLTGELVGPGALTCPCDGDCCDDPPGTRRLRFLAALHMAEIEVPVVDPGTVVPAFVFGTPEGDELFGDLALVRSHVPVACDEPAEHEWILRVTPG